MKKLRGLLADHARLVLRSEGTSPLRRVARVVNPVRDLSLNGVKLIVLTFAFAQMASVYATDWFVTTNGSGDGSSWSSPTNSIQGAIDASSAADTVWVSNGVYETGGVTGYPFATVLTNRVAIYKAITVRSANNDPINTIIKGAWDPATNGPSAVRCVYMTNGSSLIGFTLTNGATFVSGVNVERGGGVSSQSTNTVISNCVLTGNSTGRFGGGAIYGTLFNCTIVGNSAGVQGGGAFGSTLYNCTLIGNSMTTANSGYGGGGSFAGTMYNCTIISNYSAYYGGGARLATLYNCTIAGNSAIWGGGSSGGTLINSIVYFNSATIAGSNWHEVVAFTNTCTAPEATNGVGNITSDPLFVDRGAGNYRLGKGSPCINTGTNFSWMTDPADARSKDLDGSPRIDYPFSSQVDMGCYEHMHAGIIFSSY